MGLLPGSGGCQGAHRKLKHRQSYYSGDSLNKALVSPEVIEAVLDQVKAAGAVSAPSPAPAPTRSGKAGIIAAVIALLVAVDAWIANLPCNLFGIWCG